MSFEALVDRVGQSSAHRPSPGHPVAYEGVSWYVPVPTNSTSPTKPARTSKGPQLAAIRRGWAVDASGAEMSGGRPQSMPHVVTLVVYHENLSYLRLNATAERDGGPLR